MGAGPDLLGLYLDEAGSFPLLTKADEMAPAELEERITQVEAAMIKWPGAFPGILVTSARAGTGLTELRAAIARLKAERT